MSEPTMTDLRAAIERMLCAAGSEQAQRLERLCLDAAIKLCAEDGEHGCSRPRSLRLIHPFRGVEYVVLENNRAAP